MSFLSKILGNQNEREIKKLYKIVDDIEALEPEIQALKDEELKAKTNEFKNRISKGETLDDLLPEALSLIHISSLCSLMQRPKRLMWFTREKTEITV